MLAVRSEDLVLDDVFLKIQLGDAQQGLPALLGELRAFEASAQTCVAGLERRDDASGIHLYLA